LAYPKEKFPIFRKDFARRKGIDKNNPIIVLNIKRKELEVKEKGNKIFKDAVLDVRVIADMPIKLYSLNLLHHELKITVKPVRRVAKGRRKIRNPRVSNMENVGNNKYPITNTIDPNEVNNIVNINVTNSMDLASSSDSAITIDPSYLKVTITEKIATNEKNNPKTPNWSGE
jgi:hypothetical protein